MSQPNPPLRNISDTALWVAYFRALETKRPDALFRDPYAERLAGERGFDIANTLPGGNKHEWAWAARTYLFDAFALREISEGTDLLLNLAAGLDARPYRLDLPASLQWVEVDLPEIISYKAGLLEGEKPKCKLERVHLDLSDTESRRTFFAGLNLRAQKITVISEGLLIYFTVREVALLATDLAAGSHFQGWIIDLASPAQLKLMQRTTGKSLAEADAGFKFAPAEGPDFFIPFGWEPKNLRGLLETAAQLGRAPTELLSLLPVPKSFTENYPWTGVCRLTRRHDPHGGLSKEG